MFKSMDLFPVGSSKFLCQGGDSALELQDARVSLGQRVPQALKLLGQTSKLSLRLLQFTLNKNHPNWRRKKGAKEHWVSTRSEL